MQNNVCTPCWILPGGIVELSPEGLVSSACVLIAVEVGAIYTHCHTCLLLLTLSSSLLSNLDKHGCLMGGPAWVHVYNNPILGSID